MSHISGKTKMCIIIGDPVEHSLSPAMHNAAYAHLRIDDRFVFTAARVRVEDVKDVVQAMRVMGIRGLTCTIPHKIEVMQYLDEIDPIAKKIGAVNTVVNDDGVLKGYNTDWLGTVTPLNQIIVGVRDSHGNPLRLSLKNKRVALIGAGGAARAMAFGVLHEGADLTIFNRTIAKAEDLANELGDVAKNPITASGMDQISSVIDHDVIINATNIGMGEHETKTPIPKEYIAKHHIVFDAVYAPYETRLLREAQAQEAAVIHGTEMLLHQGTAQFELYTGQKAPVEVMREVLLNNI